MVLPSDEGKTLPEFQQEFFHVRDQTGFQFALVKSRRQSQKIEQIRVFEGLLYQVSSGAGRRLAKLLTARPAGSGRRIRFA